MIGIDTNVLLRYLLNDDKVQSPHATKLIQNCGTVLISNVVLAEAVWTACKQLESTLADKRPVPDFPDILILCIAKDIATTRGESFEGVHTFDKAAQRLCEMKSP